MKASTTFVDGSSSLCVVLFLLFAFLSHIGKPFFKLLTLKLGVVSETAPSAGSSFGAWQLPGFGVASALSFLVHGRLYLW